MYRSTRISAENLDDALAAGNLFDLSLAADAAQRVFSHDPGQPFSGPDEPADERAASAAVRRLGELFQSLPPSIQRALRGAENNAGNLSDDRLQGLAELIQNADDVGASRVRFAIETGSEESAILCSHNGTSLRLRDVLGLATPWLSLKANDSRSLGRFGIGLMTLRSLSDSLEVHCNHFHMTLESQSLTPVDEPPTFQEGIGGEGHTVFRIPLREESVLQQDVASWLSAWGSAGLIFLNSVESVELVDVNGEVVARVAIQRREEGESASADGTMQLSRAEADDGRRWLVYSRESPTPAHLTRSSKAQAQTTTVSLAFPEGHSDPGHFHVGLPIRRAGLPFRVSAQFDPLANRRDLADNEWNIALVAAISELWLHASLDVFRRSPHLGWATFPLSKVLDEDTDTRGRLKEALDAKLMVEARSVWASKVTFSTSTGQWGLSDLAYEHPDLTDLLLPEDIVDITGCNAALPSTARDTQALWRVVLEDLQALEGPTPVAVGIDDAIALLSDVDRSIEFISDLTAIVVKNDLAWKLPEIACVVLEDKRRITPDEAASNVALIDEEAAPVWRILKIGARVHPAYACRTGWGDVKSWLIDQDCFLRSATTEQALDRLAKMGDEGEELDDPLSDEQVETLRLALEQIDEPQRIRFGPGIGKAVRLEATSYGMRGQRRSIYARPCEAYIIEREALTWQAAAGKTSGLVWIHRRYASDIRTERGRSGIGAQRLFRLLGAETCPRMLPHPAAHKRFAYGEPGVPQDLPQLSNRKEALQGKGARYTLGDHVSPDLDAVLRSIASERKTSERIRRANALLSTLSKAWDRLEQFTEVSAVFDYGSWQDRGSVPACWVFSARSIPWLCSARGKAVTPASLSLRSPGNLAIRGNDLGLFLHPEHDRPAFHLVLEMLDVHGDPTASDLIHALETVRSLHSEDSAAAEEAAAPLYQALAHKLPPGALSDRSVGDLSLTDVRKAFARDQGLIATQQGWRRPGSVLSGPAIFGDRRTFVPAISGGEKLWRLLGVPEPSFEDARQIIRELAQDAKLDSEGQLVMLEALRLMAGKKNLEFILKGKSLTRMPVWTSTGWTTRRPVFAIPDRQLASALEGTGPVWKPGGDTQQFTALVGPLGLTILDIRHVHVSPYQRHSEDASALGIFRRAVRNLQADLAMNDPDAERALTIPWDELVEYQVQIAPGLSLDVVHPLLEPGTKAAVGAWIDRPSRTLFLNDAVEAGRAVSGGCALASLFDFETRRIAQAWMAAWSDAVEGNRAEALTLASRRAADVAARRAATSMIRLEGLRGEVASKRQPNVEGHSNSSSTGGPLGGKAPAFPARVLVDPSSLVLRDVGGELVSKSSAGGGRSDPKDSVTPNISPDTNNPKKISPGRGPLNYTSQERESVGMELVRHILGGAESGLLDIRNQHNVGADAVDELERFFELKVHQGAIPNNVSLTNSEVQRALETENFFLVLVGNVERGSGYPEVRIITDPLNQLKVSPEGSLHLTGVEDAQALIYRFYEDTDNGESSE